MNTAQDTIVQLNKYPPEQYNVLTPVTTIQAMSHLQRVIVNEVRLNPDDKSGKDVYYESQGKGYALTGVALQKLAAAANINIVDSHSETPSVCSKCIAKAKATGNAPACGTCPHQYDEKYTVTVTVPDPAGGSRSVTMSKETDCTIAKESMKDDQFKRFLEHRSSHAETKALHRCLRKAIGLKATYTKQELEKPFIIALLVPNLEAPEMQQALIQNSLTATGLLFGTQPTQAIEKKEPLALPAGEEEYDDDNGFPVGPPQEEAPQTQPDDLPPWEEPPQDKTIRCADCGNEIKGGTRQNGTTFTAEDIREYSTKHFGRCLCIGCQRKQSKANNGR